MNVLSLFDGMSCGQIALNNLGIKYDNYFASEIDKYAIQVTQKNYPNTKHIGSVTEVKGEDLPKIDLLIGGSPCQGFSVSGNKLNFEDERSKLFFEFVRLLKETKPKYFLLENVGSMDADIRDKISEILKCQPLRINSKLLTAQHRNRFYWTNIAQGEIVENDVMFKDILQKEVDKKYYYSEKVLSRLNLEDIKRTGKAGYKCKGIEVNKCAPIVARHYKGMQSQHYPVIRELDGFRKLTPIECERLQTVPDNYTQCVSDTQRFKMIGNGWTVDVIAHIFKNIPQS
jgi:DNA-cytosine methyltransferase